MRFPALFLLFFALVSCGPSAPEGPVNVAIIGNPDGLAASGLRLSTAGQHLRSATAEGLVALDENGNVVPALAERWIVTDDGLSFIFRLRNSEWPDGQTITSEEVSRTLRRNLRNLRGTSLGMDLTKIDEIRDMTGRVIEITLTGPMPDFLRLMAQPEMGILHEGTGAGPMRMGPEESAEPIVLEPIPPEMRGLPAREQWLSRTRPVSVQAMSAQDAVRAFADGEVDLVLNGRLATLPMADTGPLTRGTIRLDAALGLFGLVIRRDEGFLADPLRRQALSMAIDRESLMQPFNVGGWQSNSWIVPAEFSPDGVTQTGRWDQLSLQQRRDVARRRVTAWENSVGREVVLRIGLPDGPGSDTLFEQLSTNFELVGVTAERTGLGKGAELELHDRLARYYSARWFLNQFHCRLELGLCSEAADDLVEQSIITNDAASKSQLLAAAHRELINAEVFIPLGAPVRWSLLRGNVTGFEENRWGLHPLFPLSQSPT